MHGKPESDARPKDQKADKVTEKKPFVKPKLVKEEKLEVATGFFGSFSP